jgi:CO dehydrogenase nickel-insertion accessory protein CooC1
MLFDKIKISCKSFFMKIAVLGKGGSGKSTISWLLVNYLSSKNHRVLAIDADHNMDLAANLGFTINPQTPTIHRKHDEFRSYVDMSVDDPWSTLTSRKNNEIPSFTFPEMDQFTSQIVTRLNNTIFLTLVGLGEEDVLFSPKCSHGHSAPLKFYLPLLQTDTKSHVIIDGVAGVDMVNYGLFLGCDAVIISVENHPNSVRVARSVIDIHKKLEVPTFIVLNKQEIENSELFPEFQDSIIGSVPIDVSLMRYSYDSLSEHTKISIENIWNNLEKQVIQRNTWSRLINFEQEKQKFISHST